MTKNLYLKMQIGKYKITRFYSQEYPTTSFWGATDQNNGLVKFGSYNNVGAVDGTNLLDVIKATLEEVGIQ